MASTIQNAKNATWKNGVLRDTDLSPGRFEGTTIPADTPAEIATVEVGEDGTLLQDAIAVIIGVAADQFRATTKAKPTFDLLGDQDGDSATAVSDVPAGTLVWVGYRRRNETGGPEITPRYDEDNVSETAKTKRQDVEPQEDDTVLEPQVLTVNVYNASQSFHVSLADSTVELPIQRALP